MLNATKLGEKVGLKPQRVNAILSELGWLARAMKGWVATDNGKSLGAQQREFSKTGIPYVMWPPALPENKIFRNAVSEYIGGQSESADAERASGPDDFRGKFPAKHRAQDGHMVRSKAEILIDNWLYMAGIVHAYERKLPVEENVYCDFYIPAGKVYIEYWGLDDQPQYRARREEKLEVYRRHGFALIELRDEQVMNLDDHLPRELLKHGISVD